MEPLRPDDPEQLGPYRLVARLGAGGMGRVYLARSSHGETVAVKAIRPEMMEDKNFRIRFRREAEAARAVGGIYTAPVVDAEPDAETPWLATAYIPGPTLAEAVSEHGPLPVETVLGLGAGIAEALIAVHAAGMVHRDLKPTNVLLASDGPRVIDFGIVRALDGYELTGSGTLFGSLEYMCPEQATGDPMGPAGDIFCLGSVLAFAASGHAPFSGAAAAALLYQVVHGSPDLTRVPEPLDKIISLCLAKDPSLRITPDRLSAACAPGGAEQMFKDGWLPAPVAATIAGYTAAVMDLDIAAREWDRLTSYTADPHDSVPPANCPQAAGSATGTRRAYDSAAAGVGVLTEVRAPEPCQFSEAAEPERPTPPAHHRARTWSRVSRRTVLAASVGTALVGGAGLLIAKKRTVAHAVQPLGPAPEPTWIYRGGPLLQAPAVFTNGTALLKARPGNILCLDVQNGSQPRWVYQGISQSPTPALLVDGVVVALGTGATVIGVDAATGTEKFTLDFGADYRFDQLFGSYGGSVVSAIGVRLQRQSAEQGVATSTNTVFGIDIQARRALVIPISPEDIGIPLEPVVLPGYFVYADGLRNVTVRRTGDSGSVLWRHPVGYDLRPGLAVLGRTVFAIGSELIALDLVTGKLRWRVKADRGQFASLGVAGNTVYATGTDPSGVYAFSAANGSRRWFCETPRLNVDNHIAVGRRKLYVPAFQNSNGFYAIDTASGRLLWNFTDGRETGINDWQLSCDGEGHLVAQHFDRAYGLPV
ncbi:protein kinase domain-containing protein [Streptomyces cavernae]|uniref:protein kinase domain-containing protein n=1 Tax=Streptomyces cavernae TaxID=2259034 RepID=UPI000FEBA02D|nr:PQQ-binding-like beta-propeller repeat protein [Streptomyces cavernae]